MISLAGPGAGESIGDVSDSEIRRASNGAILRIWPLVGGTTQGAKAYRVLYRSTGLDEEPIGVTGAVIIPDNAAPQGGRPVVAWAHPTTGIATKCAPTLLPETQGSIQGLEELVRRGYVVTATDYAGLGTPGAHPYLVGVSEARAVLDSVRAARELPDSKAQDRFAVWGHSQGGHAALFAGELAGTYAPELKLVGVAAAAPATYLAELFEADRSSETGHSLAAMAIMSWSRVFKLPVDEVVDSAALSAFRKVANDCIENLSEMLTEEQDAKSLERVFLKTDPTRLAEWRALMDRNTPGQSPAGAPLFIAQGTADTTVPPRITRRFVDALCKSGASVTFTELAGVSHTFIARDAAFAAVDWMAARFGGRPARSGCRD